MRNLNQKAADRLQTVTTVVAPGFNNLSQLERERFFEIVDDALGDRPQSMCRQLALFLTVLDIAPIVRWGRPLGRLDSVRAERVLRWFQEAPIGKLRQGFWGLKTLIYMGYYGRNEVWPELGYAPSISGGSGADD